MSRNLPLDANDEDIIQRGLRRPSIEQSLNTINEEFQALRSRYDNSPAGILSVDNIWQARLAEEMQNLDPVQRRQFLEQRGLVPPEGFTPSDVSLPGVDQLVQTVTEVDSEVINRTLERSASFTEEITNVEQRIRSAVQTGSVPTDSYGQPLVGTTTQPQPVTSPPPGGSYTPPGTQPTTGGQSSVYNYVPMELYNDRYDFATGKTVRKGIATGSKGGVGTEDAPGNTVAPVGLSNTQRESPPPPPNLSPNETSQETYDDAILRQARQNTNAWSEEEARNVEQLRRFNENIGGGAASARLTPGERAYAVSRGYIQNTVDRSDDARSARTEGRTPTVQAPRTTVIRTRNETANEIREARSRGVYLVARRRPDGTYYAAPPSDVSNNQNLPQRARDF